ncbi:MAG: hypothetical protein K8F30_11160, partial [Taibaiella sp.]|nr:hypothetical protein [Taibaiella sp.]
MYYLTVSFGDSVYADSTEVVVNVNPTINISCSKTYICVEESIDISADYGFAEYYWNTGATTQTITINTGGIYTVIAKDSNGCEASNSVGITEIQPPEPEITLEGKRLCDGDKAKLLIKEEYSSYLWSTGEITDKIEITSTGKYFVEVINDYGCVGYDTIDVFFFTNLKPIVLGKSDFCFGESKTLSTDANYLEIRWNTNDTTSDITIKQAGKYWYWAKDENGCESWSDTVEVIEYPEVKVEIEGKTEICKGESTLLQATKEYSGYRWNTGEETRQIEVSEAGKYEVEVTDENGCKGIANIEVKAIEIVMSGTDEIDFGECKLKKECILTKNITNN